MEVEPRPRAGILTCWKEIASFFHRDVRTVQRWEREEGLPVHRHPHQRRSSVYAYPEELDAWWARHQSGETDRPGHPEPDVTPETRMAVAPAPAFDSTRDAHTPQPGVRWRRRRSVWLGLTAAAVAGVLVFVSRDTDKPAYPLHDLASIASPAPLQIRSLDDINGDGRGDLVVSPVLGRETLIHFGSTDGTSATPNVRITSDAPGYPTGGPVGDVDGDGLTDLLMNVLLSEPAGFTATGSSYLIKGRRTWPATLRLPEEADTEFYVALNSDIRMNGCIGSGGMDLNGDGLKDVLLGGGDYSPPGRPSAGGAFVLFGRRDWPERMDVISTADVTIHGSRTGEALRADCSVGDFTADGRADLALMASEDTLWGLQGGRGRVYVFAGAPSWPRLIDAERDARLMLRGGAPGASTATPLLADINGDAAADLVTAFGDPERRTDGGRVRVVFGGRDRRGVVDEQDADVLMNGESTFGTTVRAVDVNVDGCDDLIITNPAAGAVDLVLGDRSWGPAARVRTVPLTRLVTAEPGTGAMGVVIGDTDGDGAPDIALELGTAGTSGVHQLARLSPALPIDIDVRPGVTPNVLLPEGVLAVEVLSRSLMRDLDAPSLRLAGTAPTQLAWQDFDGNGSLDLRLYFDNRRLSLPPGSTRVALRGRTRAGQPVSGSDVIVVVGDTQAARRDK